MKRGLRRWLWLGVSIVVVGLIFYNLSRSPEWRSFQWDQFWATLTQARPGFLVAAVAVTSSSYFIRAYRWKLFLDSIKKASLWVLFVAQVLGFSSIYLIGRPGEFVRPAYIAKKEEVSFTSQLALLLLERIYDAVFLILLLAVSLEFLRLEAPSPRGASLVAWIHWTGRVMLLVSALLVAGVVVFRLRAARLTASVLRFFRFLPARALHHLERFLTSFSDGLSVIRNWRALLLSIASSAVLWALNATVFWFAFESLGGELERLPWFAAAVVMFCAAQGLIFQLPGVGGGYQVGALLALTQIFGVKAEAATGASILVWILMSLPCVGLGLLLLLYEGLTLKKLSAIAEEERTAVRGKA